MQSGRSEWPHEYLSLANDPRAASVPPRSRHSRTVGVESNFFIRTFSSPRRLIFRQTECGFLTTASRKEFHCSCLYEHNIIVMLCFPINLLFQKMLSFSLFWAICWILGIRFTWDGASNLAIQFFFKQPLHLNAQYKPISHILKRVSSEHLLICNHVILRLVE